MKVKDVPLCEVKTMLDARVERDEKTDVFFVEVSGLDGYGFSVRSVFGIFGSLEKAEVARSQASRLIG